MAEHIDPIWMLHASCKLFYMFIVKLASERMRYGLFAIFGSFVCFVFKYLSEFATNY